MLNQTAFRPKVAIIGGTGVQKLPFQEPPVEIVQPTPWGEAYGLVGRIHSTDVLFMPRHGAGHRLPPHRIVHRANLAGLAALGVRAVIATAAVGGLRMDLPPGQLILLDDFIDMVGARDDKTFFDAAGHVVHTDFTRPYSDIVRATIRNSAERLKIPLRDGGTYLCVSGPRYESPAEVRLFASWGADVVGMTGIPEATLAREAGLHYASIALVTNYGVGLTDTPVAHHAVEDVMRSGIAQLLDLIVDAATTLSTDDLPSIGPGEPLPTVR